MGQSARKRARRTSASSVLREGVKGDLASEGSKGVSQRNAKEQTGLGTRCACMSVRTVGGGRNDRCEGWGRQRG